ncbi:Aminomethyltransferase related to GcvT [Rickettsiales bacterium Ac37b]|nr:Aminomethyltransferase related to GcvT [Rickettsiales bacterium Ac37b]
MSNLLYNILKDRATFSIHGEDTKTFLQNLISNDINKVNANNSIYTCLLTPQGKYFCDFFVMLFNDTIILDCSYARREEIISKLNIYKLRSSVQIQDLTDQYTVFSLHGDDLLSELALSDIPGYSKSFMNGYVYVDPRTTLMGARTVLPTNTAIQFFKDWGFKPSSDPYDHLRIQNNIPEGDKDLIPGKSFPLEYGFDLLNAIDFNKGCYIGQELTSRTKHRGSIRKKIIRVKSDTSIPELGNDIYIGENKVGIICSSYSNIGLALIRTEDYEQNASSGNKMIIRDQDNIAVLTVIGT